MNFDTDSTPSSPKRPSSTLLPASAVINEEGKKRQRHSEMYDENSPNTRKMEHQTGNISTPSHLSEREKSSSTPVDGEEPGVSAPKIENDSKNGSIKECVIQRLFQDVKPINFEFGGNSLHIVGSAEEADRITDKFYIMRKLANLVGCGFDCHFRMANNEFRLMMLVRGVPRVLFGSTVTVIPDITNIRKHATAGGFVEAAQLVFFDKILDLVPQNFENGRRIVLSSLTKGNEDIIVKKLYDFLKDIRPSILTNLSKFPILWTVPEFPSEDDDDFNLELIRRTTIKQCGENHLLALENETPGYVADWFKEWDLGRVYTFDELMKQKFQELP